MKKLLCLLIIVSTFFVGLIAYRKFSQSQSVITDGLTIPDYLLTTVSLCEATSDYEKYKSVKPIRLKAYLSIVGEENYLYFSEIEKDCFDSYAELYPWNASDEPINALSKKHLDGQTQKFVESLKERNTEQLTGVAEVVITGKLVKRSVVGIVQSYFYIEVKDIKQLSPIKAVNIFEERAKAKQNQNSN